MEDRKPEKLKLKLKYTKQQDHQQLVLVHLHHQPAPPPPPQTKQEYELEEGEIRDEEREQVPDQVEEQQEEVGEIKEKTCPQCGRVFQNGKALGGHMRVHAVNPPKPTTKKPAGSSPSPGTAEVFRCTICTKEFPTQKSLFGHMRSHPERDYRGMQPPMKLSHNSDDNSDDQSPSQSQLVSSAMDRLRGMMGWKVTGKRGQKAYTSAKALSSSLSYGHRAEVAAGDLMLLLAGGDEEEEEDQGKSKSTPQEEDDDDDDVGFYLQSRKAEEGKRDWWSWRWSGFGQVFGAMAVQAVDEGGCFQADRFKASSFLYFCLFLVYRI